MSNRPFKCSKCGNWYIQLPNPDGAFCSLCQEGTHTDRSHCHFGQSSSTPSEIKMAELLGLVQVAQKEAALAVIRINASTDIDSVKAVMARAEQSFAKADVANGDLPEILRWATVMELPGMQGSPREARFKNIDAIQELVSSNRRPPEDLEMLIRSDKVCREIATEIPGSLSEARITLGQARQAAQAWKAAPADVPMPENVPSTRKLTNAESLAKARAARKPRELVNA